MELDDAVEESPCQETPLVVPISEEVLERLRGMEQQVQLALIEIKKKDQQLATERSSLGRFKVSSRHYCFTCSHAFPTQ